MLRGYTPIFAYGKMSPQAWKAIRNPLPSNLNGFSNPDGDQRGPWRSIPFSAQGWRPNQMYVIKAPDGARLEPPRGRCWGATEEVFLRYLADNRVYFPRGGAGRPRIKQFAGEEAGLVPMSLWLADEVGTTEESKREILGLFTEANPFGTPKPERLMQRIIHIASNRGELVLDSFLGSGTTAAVAHKMGRRYIGIEMGEHAVTHCQPRLNKVIEGEQGGVSGVVGWSGGGGFRFFRLGPAVFDEHGKIRGDIEFATLAAHIWFSEARAPWSKPEQTTTVLGVHDGRAIALLYNGILKDRSVDGGNVLTRATLSAIRADLPAGFDGPLLVYGERCILSLATLKREDIVFKQTPYDVKARA
jgi:adenine-specific DNA-methyltransferase